MVKGSHLHTHIVAHVAEVRIVLQLRNQISLCSPNDPFTWEDELEGSCNKRFPHFLLAKSKVFFLSL